MDTSSAYLLLTDMDGRLCRVPRGDASLSDPLLGADARKLAGVAVTLLRRVAVREAIRATWTADHDPAGYDLWRMPLLELTCPGRSLRPLLQTYCAWDAYTRRRFEQVLGILADEEEACAQYAAIYGTLLGSMTDQELALSRGVSPTAIRMARSRGRRFLARYLGEALVA